MNTGSASGVVQFAPAGDTPSTLPLPENPSPEDAGMTTPSLAGPPAYLLRETLLPRETGPTESPDDPPGAGAQVVMPAIMALVEAGESGESPENLPLVIEALLFAAEEPPTVSQLAQATHVSRDAIEEALDELAAAAAERGLRVQRDGGSVRLVTAPEAAPSIQRLLGLDRPNKLSKAALETLAIIAYQQPVTRGAVERVRGVTCDGPLATLRGRELIASIGQADTPGRPHLWATTPAFLDHFGLTALTELPPLPGVPAPVAQGALDLDAPAPVADATSAGDAATPEDAEDGPNADLPDSATEDPTTRDPRTVANAAAPAEMDADTDGGRDEDSDADETHDDADQAPLPVASAGPAPGMRTPVQTGPYAENDLDGLAAAGGD